VLEHVFFWCAIGSIMLFIPYFLISKHIHLVMGPVNFALKPARRSIGELDKINFEDESLTQFGVSKLEHLSRPQLLDAYACIMCNRCQDVCPANYTGKVLSPSALEINKRYQINQEGKALAAGKESSTPLIEFAISPEAVWACTSCGACIEVCPVGNEPMRDILDIRRSLVLMDNQFPTQLQQAFKGMERTGNVRDVVFGGAEHDLGLVAAGHAAEIAKEFIAVHDRHVPVEQDGFGQSAPADLECLFAVFGFDNLEIQSFQYAPCNFSDDAGVINDQTCFHLSLCSQIISEPTSNLLLVEPNPSFESQAAIMSGVISSTRSTSRTTISCPSRRCTPPASLAMRGSRLTGFSSRPSSGSLSTSPI